MSELSEQYNEPDFHFLTVFFSVQFPVEDAMQIFCVRILPYAEMIETENDRFFLECTDLFEGVQKDKVHYFKDLWTSNRMSADDRKTMWKWFKFFLKLAQKYKELEKSA
jgi:hypothetical protein